MRMAKVAVERRAEIIRYIASHGGLLEGETHIEISKRLNMPLISCRNHLQNLERMGILHVTREIKRGLGQFPNRYLLLHNEQWFRKHADELATVFYKAKPPRLPPPGEERPSPPEPEPEPEVDVRVNAKPPPISAALKRALIEEGMALDSTELAAWGS